MRMSGTKPMKNTMRKKSPLKELLAVTAATKAAKGVEGALEKAKAAREASGRMKVGGALEKAKAVKAEIQALKAKRSAQATKPTPSAGGKPSNPNPPKTISKTPTDAKSAAAKPAATASKGAPAASAVLQLKKHKR